MEVKRPIRFWSKVNVAGLDECWEWLAHKNYEGYGLFGIDHKPCYVNRVSWYLANGKIPEGLCVCHHCDNPSCVNPAHLFLGTHKDNQVDAARKGRKAKKLISSEVREIRELLADSWSQQEIADTFGVSQATISRISRNKNWAWLE